MRFFPGITGTSRVGRRGGGRRLFPDDPVFPPTPAAFFAVLFAVFSGVSRVGARRRQGGARPSLLGVTYGRWLQRVSVNPCFTTKLSLAEEQGGLGCFCGGEHVMMGESGSLSNQTPPYRVLWCRKEKTGAGEVSSDEKRVRGRTGAGGVDAIGIDVFLVNVNEVCRHNPFFFVGDAACLGQPPCWPCLRDSRRMVVFV